MNDSIYVYILSIKQKTCKVKNLPTSTLASLFPSSMFTGLVNYFSLLTMISTTMKESKICYYNKKKRSKVCVQGHIKMYFRKRKKTWTPIICFSSLNITKKGSYCNKELQQKYFCPSLLQLTAITAAASQKTKKS